MGFLFGKKEEKLNDRVFIIAGLGNPGKEYDKTRHNIGFDVMDSISKELNIDIRKKQFEAICGLGHYKDYRILLMKPQTYMNLSGQAIAFACNYYKIPIDTNLVVIYDDIALPVGNIRIRPSGSAGGHNGMKSIISALASDKFMRLRIGIGEKKSDELVNHVLGRFSKDDRTIIDKSIENATKAILCIIDNDCGTAMNRYNTARSESKKEAPLE